MLMPKPPFNCAGISTMHVPNNRAPPIPRSGAPAIMHRPPFSWEIQRKIHSWHKKSALQLCTPLAGEATSLQLCRCKLIWGGFMLAHRNQIPGHHAVNRIRDASGGRRACGGSAGGREDGAAGGGRGSGGRSCRKHKQKLDMIRISGDCVCTWESTRWETLGWYPTLRKIFRKII